ncbi:autotransporter domain-containing protein [Shinella fusca]|uniref:Outer membrane autotransporter protein n=1 Tax=Shinella fusca TaxID=544480 RepID=A0A7W7YWS9_9HYPH|nr:autotransporter domain-containing protein [Shinella fusca]MBB5043635.1 outer membrane autotransporter protein [Shinella fusca]
MQNRTFNPPHPARGPRLRHVQALLAGASMLALGLPASADTVELENGEVETGAISQPGNTTFLVKEGAGATMAGTISGTGSVSKTGPGTLTITGENSYFGGTDIAGGYVWLTHGSGLGTGTVTFNGGGLGFLGPDALSMSNDMVFNNATVLYTMQDTTLSGVLSGGSLFKKFGEKTLTLTGENTFTGGLLIHEGTVRAENGKALGSGTITFDSGTLGIYTPALTTLSNDMAFNGNATLDTAQHTTISGTLSGAGGLTKTGGGTLTLSADNSAFSGGLTVRSGTVRAENDHALGTGVLSIGRFGYSSALSYADGVTVDNDVLITGNTDFHVAAGTATQSGRIDQASGMHFLAKTGAGELVVTSAIDAGYQFRVNEGQLTAAVEDVLAGRSYAIFGAGTLKLEADQQVATVTSAGKLDLGSRKLTLGTDAQVGADFSGKLVGDDDAHLVKVGRNSQTLNGDGLDYYGRITVEAGNLSVGGNFAGAPVLVTGGRLSGAGQLGDVTVDGGILAGKDGGTLSMRDLYLTGNAIVEANLGTENSAALFDVAGDLVLDGTLNVNNMGGFGPGLYRLISYAGALDDRGLEIGTAPMGYDADNLAVQTSMAGQVNLVADDPDYGPVMFWDGDDPANRDNGKIDGGDGQWSKYGYSFTDAYGMQNGKMDPQPGFAVFGGKAGNVVVYTGIGEVKATGMQFATDGYVISGELLELVAGDAFIRVGDGTAAGASYTATIANKLDGAGKLIKTDLGKLILTGDSAYRGGTEVREGTLQIGDEGNEGSIAGLLDVGADGRLTGLGMLEQVVVSGTIAPGLSIGTLHVADIAFNEGSVFEVEVNADGESDRILASGVATLDGGTVMALGGTGNYAAATRYTILSADGGFASEDDRFDGVTSNLAFLTPDLEYDENNVYLTMTRNGVAFENVGNTRNQVATAGAVESLGAGNAVYDAALGLSSDQARGAFDRLSGEIHASAKAARIEDSRFLRNAVNDRLRAAFDAAGAPAGMVVTYDDGRPGAAAASTDGFALWSQGFGAWDHTGGDGNAARLNRSTGGFFAGADASVFDNWRFGAVAGYSHSSFEVKDRGSSGSSDNYHFGLYGGAQWGEFALRTGGAYTWHDISTSRSVAFAGFTDSLKADYDAGTGQVFGELAYGFGMGEARFEPFANLAYVNLHTDGFAEKGGAAALKAGASSTDMAFTTLGLRASTNVDLDGTTVTARGMVGWRHGFGNMTPTSRMRFAGAGDAFTVAGVPVARNVAVVEAGLDVALTPDADFGVSYGAQFGSGAVDQSLKANLNIRF